MSNKTIQYSHIKIFNDNQRRELPTRRIRKMTDLISFLFLVADLQPYDGDLPPHVRKEVDAFYEYCIARARNADSREDFVRRMNNQMEYMNNKLYKED